MRVAQLVDGCKLSLNEILVAMDAMKIELAMLKNEFDNSVKSIESLKEELHASSQCTEMVKKELNIAKSELDVCHVSHAEELDAIKEELKVAKKLVNECDSKIEDVYKELTRSDSQHLSDIAELSAKITEERTKMSVYKARVQEVLGDYLGSQLDDALVAPSRVASLLVTKIIKEEGKKGCIIN